MKHIPISNQEFLEALFPDLPKDAAVAVARVRDLSGAWPADPWTHGQDYEAEEGQNAYFCGASHKNEWPFHRTKKSFQALYYLILDDVGTKVARDAIRLKATYAIETSSGNFQLGFKLKEFLTDLDLVDRLGKSVIAAGLSDPGAGGLATRFARLPQGSNTKRNPLWKCGLVTWRPGLAYTLEELLDGLGIELVQPKPKPEAKPCPKITATLSTPYGKAALEDECKAIADAPAGQRHDQLFKSVAALGGLIAGGEVVEVEARAEIMEAVESWNTGAESEDKTLDTIEDALATGMTEPRQAPREAPPLNSGGAGGAGGASPGWPGVQVCPGYENKSGAPGAGGGKVGAVMPRGYFVNAAGLHYVDNSNPDKDPVTYRLGPFIEVVARTRDATSAEWGLLVRWRDPDGVLHEWAMPATRLFAQDGGWIAELARCGWTPEPGAKQRALLAAFFAKVSPSARVRCVLRVGWYDGRFVLPGQVYGLGQEPVVLQSRMATDPYTQRGELAAWQDTIGQWSRGNSRLILAVCLALSGPLLSVVGMGPGGVNLFGGSSSGKTTSLHAALSVWGGPESKNSWNATKNGLEGALELHNDTFYTLDEMAEAPGKTMTEVVYMLGNGAGRARANQDGSARAVRRWCCSILSTGEIGVEEKLRQEGQVPRAGHGVRLLEVPADAGAGLGCWENLHGYESGRDFSEAIDAASRENYGHAGRAFVQALAEHMKEMTIVQDLDIFSKKWTPTGAAGQVGRVVRRFAIMAVAGELAAGMGILPWTPGEALRGIKRCLDDWMQARGGTDDAESAHAVRAVRAYITRYGQARFESLGSDHAERIIDRSGFKRVVEGKTQFVLTADQLGAILPGQNLTQAVKALDRAGILRCNEGRKTQKVSIPDLGRTRCYVLELPEDGGDA